MQNMVRIAKVNVCALLAFPLLVLSLIAMLLKKALEKAMIFLGVGVAVLVLNILRSIFLNPGSFFDGLGTFLAILILFGTVVVLVAMIMLLIGGVATVVVSAVVAVLMKVFETIFDLCHRGYSKLFDLCKVEFRTIETSEESPKSKFACVFWYILLGVNKVVVTLLSAAFPISIIGGIGFLAYSVYSVHSTVSDTYGIGILSYLQLFSGVQIVFAVVYFIIVVLAVEVILISLGIEWSELGQVYKFSTQDYRSYCEAVEQMVEPIEDAAEMDYTFSAGQSAQRCSEYMEILRGLFANVDNLHQQVNAAMGDHRETSLIYEFTSYMELLSQILKKMEGYGTEIPCHEFEHKLIPAIEEARRKERELEKEVFNLLNKRVHDHANQEQIDFFAGCETCEDVRKRYKALCKVYHPDVGGHEETFKQLHAQYEMRCRTTSTTM